MLIDQHRTSTLQSKQDSDLEGLIISVHSAVIWGDTGWDVIMRTQHQAIVWPREGKHNKCSCWTKRWTPSVDGDSLQNSLQLILNNSTWNLQHDSRGQHGLHRSSASITPDSEIFEAMVLKTGAETGHRPRRASERVLEDCSERFFSQANPFGCILENDRWKTGHPPVWPHTPHDTLTIDGY